MIRWRPVRASRHHRQHGIVGDRRRSVVTGAVVAAVAALIALTVSVGVGLGGSDGSTPAAKPVTHTVAPSTATPAPTPTPAATTATAAPAPPSATTTGIPVRVQIPAIGVNSSLQSLGLTAAGELQQPSQWLRAGWYSGGVRPGDPGPAVIAGHVDSTAGPAVFFRLKELHSGDRVLVTDKSGKVRTFVVDSLVDYAKKAFPTQAVYGPTPTSVLRLITCTGDFDAAAHSYVDNLVVSAHLAA